MRKQIESRVLQPDEKMKAVFSHQALTYGYLASFALDLMRVGSFVPCLPTGEFDKQGTPIYRLQTPEELVARSIEITEAAFKEFAARDWSCEHPPLEDLIETTGPVGFSSHKERA